MLVLSVIINLMISKTRGESGHAIILELKRMEIVKSVLGPRREGNDMAVSDAGRFLRKLR